MTTRSWEKSKAESDALEVKARFDHFVPTEESAVDFLFLELARRELLRCKSCGNQRFTRQNGERDMVCSLCRRVEWFTAGTFFDHAKHIRPWLFMLSLAHKGIRLSGPVFARLAGITSSSSWEMNKKVDMAILECMPDDAATVSSSVFLRIFFKRSRLTPADEHPSAEQDHVAQDEQADTAFEDLPPEEAMVFNCLDPEPMSFDKLCAKTQLKTSTLSSHLIMLEFKGLAQQVAGDAWKKLHRSGRPSDCKVPDSLCQLFVRFIRMHFHGISRKYVQPYLATFWRHLNSTRWPGRSILDACLKVGPIHYYQLLSYTSPALVKVTDTRPNLLIDRI